MLWVVAGNFSGTVLSTALSSCLEDHDFQAMPPSSFYDSAGSLTLIAASASECLLQLSETDISSSLPFNLASKGELWSCCVDSS